MSWPLTVGPWITEIGGTSWFGGFTDTWIVRKKRSAAAHVRSATTTCRNRLYRARTMIAIQRTRSSAAVVASALKTFAMSTDAVVRRPSAHRRMLTSTPSGWPSWPAMTAARISPITPTTTATATSTFQLDGRGSGGG